MIYGLNAEFVDLSKPFDQDMFRAILSIANAIRDKMHEGAGRNKKKAQAMQKSDFDPLQRLMLGTRCLFKNNRRNDGKGDKFICRWLGPYIVTK